MGKINGSLKEAVKQIEINQDRGWWVGNDTTQRSKINFKLNTASKCRISSKGCKEGNANGTILQIILKTVSRRGGSILKVKEPLKDFKQRFRCFRKITQALRQKTERRMVTTKVKKKNHEGGAKMAA